MILYGSFHIAPDGSFRQSLTRNRMGCTILCLTFTLQLIEQGPESIVPHCSGPGRSSVWTHHNGLFTLDGIGIGTRIMGNNISWSLSQLTCNVKLSTLYHTIHLFPVPVQTPVPPRVNKQWKKNLVWNPLVSWDFCWCRNQLMWAHPENKYSFQ